MRSKRKVLIIFGAGTRLLAPLLDGYARTGTIVRLFRTVEPAPKEGCIDISSLDDLEPVLVSLEREFEFLDIDFIGAASEYQDTRFSTLSEETLSRLVKTGVTDYVYVLRLLLRFMIRSRYGRLVFLSSFRTVNRGIGVSLYAASKSFNETLFSSLGAEYGRLGIYACSIRMGYFDGRMLDNLRSSRTESPPSLKHADLGGAEELCSAVQFALSNKMTNGGVIELCGGLSFE